MKLGTTSGTEVRKQTARISARASRLLGGVFEVVPPAEVDTDVLAEQNSTVGEVIHHLNTYENEEVIDLTNYI